MNGSKVWNGLGAALKGQGYRGTATILFKRIGSSLMNMNRQNNNNRRRGRGNNNNRQQNNNRNGYDHQNRVDNRARGNAAQMLEKYKKLASDAQHNDDRVNAEYYLQFADHYFRVLADFKSRQEERQGEQQQRRPNRDDWQNEDGEAMEGVEATESEDSVDSENDEGENEQREERSPRPPRRERSNERSAERRPRRHHSEEEADDNESGIDLSILPPSISTSVDEAEDEPVELVERPARKPRTRRPAASANDEQVVDAAE